MPPALLAAVSLVVPLVREIREMGYQWEEPFLCDDSRFRARFGVAPVPREEAARRTVEWAVAEYRARAARAA